MQQNHHPYGQHQLPMQPSPAGRRHDPQYQNMNSPMRPHPMYQPQYYPQHMAPYNHYQPHYAPPAWYPPYHQQQHPIHPVHTGRTPYYPQHSVPSQPYPPHHQGPLIVNSHQTHQPHPSPQPSHLPRPTSHQQPLPPAPAPQNAAAPTPSMGQAPPSPPLSTASTINTRKDSVSPVVSISPSPQQSPVPLVETPREPFQPPIPWLSVENEPFPPRAPKFRRRVPRSLLASQPVVYPLPAAELPAVEDADGSNIDPGTDQQDAHPHDTGLSETSGQDIDTTEASTPLPSDAPSDTISTQPTTPSSAVPASTAKSQQTPTQPKARPAGPIIPAVPILPPSPTATRKPHRDSMVSDTSRLSEGATAPEAPEGHAAIPTTGPVSEPASEPLSAPVPVAPKSWANLFRANESSSASASGTPSSLTADNLGLGKAESLSEVLNDVNASTIEVPSKLSFLKPRGLVNTGNMCYMNSVLQVLVFSLPFYDFLAKVAQRAAHTFKSDTPLVDAIILFVQEYPVIASAKTVEQLRLRLKPEDLEKYGDPFIPEYVYSAIKDLPRFREMRRGHQQDAQEFLGFLLEELHEECARAMKATTLSTPERTTPAGSVSNFSETVDSETGWMEVGHKQKPAVTRSSGGIVTESPVTSIFGGKLRSELKVSGNKMSVTLEPYSPLQLDIGAPSVHNIIDALKGLTRPESMQGDFSTSRGQKTTATKQVFIETLPPVLILHLKRFHYDTTTKRAEKIWKKVGYPLELELPKEVFPLKTRNKYAAHGGLPKYRLTAVIYHHGKNANGGHYTVDIRRQDDREWVRIDDTLIRRIRSEDVAEGGSEEDPKVLAAALERHNASGNRFEQIDQDGEEEEGTERVWSQVNGHSRSKSTMSAIVNGSSTPAMDSSSGKQTPNPKYSIKDNKVAYLLFYQRILA